MRSDKPFARSLKLVAVVNLLIIVSGWAQNPQKTQSAVPSRRWTSPALPIAIPS